MNYFRKIFAKKENHENLQQPKGGWADFKKLLRKRAKKLASDDKNYSDSFKCSVCKKKVVLTFFTSFRIFHNRKRTLFIAFHSNCAFKKKYFNKKDEIVQSFDYIAEV